MMNQRINVIVLSQQVLFRTGVEMSLSPVEDITVTGSADFSNGIQFSLDDAPPDVALLDIDDPNETGLEFANKIKQRLPNIAVIVFTSKPSDNEIFQALKAQAVAYMSKEVSTDDMIETIRRVYSGEYPINESLHTRPKVAERVLQKFQELSLQDEAIPLISPLTARETEILQYIAQGYLNKQIASVLDISEQTIKNHVTSILRKLNANARTEAVVIALRQGFITLD